ncbi:MAG: ATP-binding protein [Bacteroidales bacterium]
MITTEQKKQILEQMLISKKNYNSDAKFATSLGISAAQLSRVMKGETERVLSDANWIMIGRKLKVISDVTASFKTARTPVYETITAQLEACRVQGMSALLCDAAGIGKTYAAKEYVMNHANCVYIDCSQVKSKQRLIRQIAKEFGLNNTGKYADVYENLICYLQGCTMPLIVLDEAGDLEYPAFLELKALWNATQYVCGWYMMGADGLKAKIERNISCNKVGYTELFRRFGERYQRITPTGREDMETFKKTQIAIVCKANGIADVQGMYARTGGSLTRLYIEYKKNAMNHEEATV